MSIFSIQPQRVNTQWTSPEEQLRLLRSLPYENELLKRLPTQLTNIVSEYATEDFGSNIDNWYNVLRKLNILPESIPPLPSNIHDILGSPCPIFGSPNRVTDTHTLWLIPGGKIEDINTLAELCGVSSDTQEHHWRLEQSTLSGFKMEKMKFESPTWILISNLLPRSLQLNYSDQKKMIAKLRKKTVVNYEVPSFKYMLAANLLKMQTDGKGLWEEGKLTRVKESFLYNHGDGFGAECYTLAMGSSSKNDHTWIVIRHCSKEPGDPLWNKNVGIVALWVGFRPKPLLKQSCCVLS